MVLYGHPLNHCGRAESACYYANKAVKITLQLSKLRAASHVSRPLPDFISQLWRKIGQGTRLEISSADSLFSMNHGSSPDTIVNVRGFTQTPGRYCTSLLFRFIISESCTRFTCGAWQSTGRYVVQASCVQKKKKKK